MLFTLFLIFMFSCLGIIFFYYVVKPFMENNCIYNNGNCLKFSYKKKDNSLLIKSNGNVIWYNGDNIYLYDTNEGGRYCKDTNFQPALKISDNQINEYECIKNINILENDFLQSDEQNIFLKVDNPYSVDIYKIIQYFKDKKIIA